MCCRRLLAIRQLLGYASRLWVPRDVTNKVSGRQSQIVQFWRNMIAGVIAEDNEGPPPLDRSTSKAGRIISLSVFRYSHRDVHAEEGRGRTDKGAP